MPEKDAKEERPEQDKGGGDDAGEEGGGEPEADEDVLPGVIEEEMGVA